VLTGDGCRSLSRKRANGASAKAESSALPTEHIRGEPNLDVRTVTCRKVGLCPPDATEYAAPLNSAKASNRVAQNGLTALITAIQSSAALSDFAGVTWLKYSAWSFGRRCACSKIADAMSSLAQIFLLMSRSGM
jgi:hypothetical protein